MKAKWNFLFIYFFFIKVCNVIVSCTKMLACGRNKAWSWPPHSGHLFTCRQLLKDASVLLQQCADQPLCPKGDLSRTQVLRDKLIPDVCCEDTSLFSSSELCWIEWIHLSLSSSGRNAPRKVHTNYPLVELVLLCFLNVESCSSYRDTQTVIPEMFQYLTSR